MGGYYSSLLTEDKGSETKPACPCSAQAGLHRAPSHWSDQGWRACPRATKRHWRGLWGHRQREKGLLGLPVQSPDLQGAGAVSTPPELTAKQTSWANEWPRPQPQCRAEAHILNDAGHRTATERRAKFDFTPKCWCQLSGLEEGKRPSGNGRLRLPFSSCKSVCNRLLCSSGASGMEHRQMAGVLALSGIQSWGRRVYRPCPQQQNWSLWLGQWSSPGSWVLSWSCECSSE